MSDNEMDRWREVFGAWGLPPVLLETMTSDKDDDARCGGPLGGREPEDAGHYVDRSIDRFAERARSGLHWVGSRACEFNARPSYRV